MQRSLAILLGLCGVVVLGIGIGKARQKAGPTPVVEQFLHALLEGDTETLTATLSPAALDRITKTPIPEIPGVSPRVGRVSIKDDRAVVRVTLVAPQDFVRGRVQCVRNDDRWLVESLDLETKGRETPVIDTATTLDELADQPGVDVRSF